MGKLNASKEEFKIFIEKIISLLKASKVELNCVLLVILSNLITQKYNINSLVEIRDFWQTLVDILVKLSYLTSFFGIILNYLILGILSPSR
jgi:hypothetical protein